MSHLEHLSHLEHTRTPEATPAQDPSLDQLRAIASQLVALNSRLRLLQVAAIMIIVSFVAAVIFGIVLGIVHAVQVANWDNCVRESVYVNSCGPQP